jgi:hypothetical protein
LLKNAYCAQIPLDVITANDLEYYMYEYDAMEINCSQLIKNSKGDLNTDRYFTKSSEVLTVLVELYEMTYCSAPDGFYSEVEDKDDKVSNTLLRSGSE